MCGHRCVYSLATGSKFNEAHIIQILQSELSVLIKNKHDTHSYSSRKKQSSPAASLSLPSLLSVPDVLHISSSWIFYLSQHDDQPKGHTAAPSGPGLGSITRQAEGQ